MQIKMKIKTTITTIPATVKSFLVVAQRPTVFKMTVGMFLVSLLFLGVTSTVGALFVGHLLLVT